MKLQDKKIRIVGALAMGIIHYLFFMVEVLVSVKDTQLLIWRTIATTVLFVITQWEITRWILMKTYKKWGNTNRSTRKITNALILIPFAFLIEAGRLQIDSLTHFWTNPTFSSWSVYLINFRVSLIFVFLQVVLYECFFAFYEKKKSEQRAEKLKQLNLQIQYDSLKVQIQPHFLFNTLNTLVALIKQDAIRAVTFTEELAFVYRYFLSATDASTISLKEELNFTNAYYYLFKTRYPTGLEIEFPVLNEINSAYYIPTLSIQLLVENAIKHNIISNRKPLIISIELDRVNASIRVTNNLQRKKRTDSQGKGLKHLKKKYSLLNMPAPEIWETGEIYSVTLPLIEKNEISIGLNNKSYESCYY